jgi:hypothetical protein
MLLELRADGLRYEQAAPPTRPTIHRSAPMQHLARARRADQSFSAQAVAIADVLGTKKRLGS